MAASSLRMKVGLIDDDMRNFKGSGAMPRVGHGAEGHTRRLSVAARAVGGDIVGTEMLSGCGWPLIPSDLDGPDFGDGFWPMRTAV